MTNRRLASGILLAVAVGLGTAACGGSSSPSSSSSSSTPPAASTSAAAATTSAPAATTSAASTGGSASATITANWTAFFDPKTPVATKVGLLQNGPTFESILTAQASNPQSATSSAKVISVTVSGSTATVIYDILLSGTPVLSNQKGVAVNQGGTWKVGDASFCALDALQVGGTAKLPTVCKNLP